MASAFKRMVLHAYGKVMMVLSGCIFCQVIAREQPSTLVYEDERCIAFEDVNPKAPIHVLVVPRKHTATLKDSTEEDEGLLGHLLLVASRVAKEKGIIDSGFRTVINTNAGAGQTVFHLHMHVLGGRSMRWPPG